MQLEAIVHRQFVKRGCTCDCKEVEADTAIGASECWRPVKVLDVSMVLRASTSRCSYSGIAGEVSGFFGCSCSSPSEVFSMLSYRGRIE